MTVKKWDIKCALDDELFNGENKINPNKKVILKNPFSTQQNESEQSNDVAGDVQSFEISYFLMSLLKARGLKNENEITRYLLQGLTANFDNDSETGISNPFDLKDMKKAVDRINKSVDDGEKILIYGDYDADGITATYILYSYLRDMAANVTFFIPERERDGYGLNKRIIDLAKEKSVDLIITVDNGISCFEEAKYAKINEIDLIITDHHQPGDEIPDCVAVIDPHQKDCKSNSECKNLCGAGVAMKLVSALEDDNTELVIENYSHIATIGTVGDIVSLTGENRIIVKQGIRKLKESNNLGIQALLNAASVKPENLNATTIAYALVPRINAAGRLNHAKKALKLLLTEDNDTAIILADEINEYNQKRKNIENEILSLCEIQLTQTPKKIYNRVLVFSGIGWHKGVIGIVAAKLTEKYQKPTVVISIPSFSDDEQSGLTTTQNDLSESLKAIDTKSNFATASSRSYDGFDLYKALSSKPTVDFLEKFGGHAGAAGFSLKKENIENFEKAINEYAKKNFFNMPDFILSIDKEVNINELTLENIKDLELLEPFGKDNPKPVFCIKNAKITKKTPISSGKYLRFTIEKDGKIAEILTFAYSFERFNYSEGDKVNVAFNAEINLYNERESVSLKLVDIVPSSLNYNFLNISDNIFSCFMRNEPIKQENLSKIIPTDDDMKNIFLFFKNNDGYSKPIEILSCQMVKYKINLCKLKIAIEMLKELDLIEINENKIILKSFKGKTDYKKAGIYQSLLNLNKK